MVGIRGLMECERTDLREMKKLKKCGIYSQLSSCSTAMGTSFMLSLVGPTKVKAC